MLSGEFLTEFPMMYGMTDSVHDRRGVYFHTLSNLQMRLEGFVGHLGYGDKYL